MPKVGSGPNATEVRDVLYRRGGSQWRVDLLRPQANNAGKSLL